MAKGAVVSAEKVVKDIRLKTRRSSSAEEKIRVVLEGLRGEESIATLCLWHSRFVSEAEREMVRRSWRSVASPVRGRFHGGTAGG